jgi:hypothetical protein
MVLKNPMVLSFDGGRDGWIRAEGRGPATCHV